MVENIKENIKKKLEFFIRNFNEHRESLKDASEQTMRSWIDEFLLIFDWNCKDINQVHQEKMLTKEEKEKLKSIGSTHTKPDYTLKNGKTRLNFLDAKDLQDNLRESKEIAFQARSYGWSAGLECSIVTNIEELVFYSCFKEPKQDDKPDLNRLYYKIEDYLDKFDEIFTLLYRENIILGEQSKVVKESISNEKTEMIYLDQSFAKLLSEFRVSLAENILKNNKALCGNRLNTIIQNIVNKILFIRICESRGLEEKNVLLNLLNENFWDNFRERSVEHYEIEYDGPIFNDLNYLNEISLDNTAFIHFIKNLYEPSPYKFDVIPVELFAEMYERFLSTEIFIEKDVVKQKQKDFYIKQQGAISTPKFMVDFLLDQTFGDFNNIKTLDDLFELKILEPACGSGTFLLGILEILERKAVALFDEGKINVKQQKLFMIIDNMVYPTVELRRKIITSCIYAIDMDYQAVEVAKMSLALKLVDNFSLPAFNNELGLNRKYLLEEIGKNIIHGNTLVGFDILERFEEINNEIDVLNTIVPLDIKQELPYVFRRGKDNRGGFDYIVGNPPYVETKMYIDGLPYCREYFKMAYDLDDEKADMSIYFIERCMSLLKEKGKLAFLCQRRFFKTQYGEKTRKYMSNNKFIDTIVEFEACDIFKDRITYIALLIVNNSPSLKESFNYIRIIEDSLLLKHKLSRFTVDDFNQKDISILSQNTWNFAQNDELQKLVVELGTKFNTLECLKRKNICDIHGGIQVLRNDVYYINDAKIEGNFVKGINRRKDKHAIKDVCVELEVSRPIVANKRLRKFQDIKPTYYAIVPYTQEVEPIDFKQLKEQYPYCAEYLLSQEQYIRENNKEILEGDKWNLFTRRTNLHFFSGKKILFPMTAKEVIASYTPDPVYPDNANMWALTFKEEDDDFHLAITALLNSKLFSVMAIHYSNPQANGYRKMNKQFVLPVPIPYEKIKSDVAYVNTLKEFYQTINKLQNNLDNASTQGEIRALSTLIIRMYNELNSFIYDLYELNALERFIIEDCYNSYTTT